MNGAAPPSGPRTSSSGSSPMRPYVLCAALFAVALFVARPTRADDKKSADDDKKYTITPTHFPAKSKSLECAVSTTAVTTTKVIGGDGNVLREQKDNWSSERAYVEKTLDVDGKAKTRKKYSRAYEKATDLEGGQAEDKPFSGRTILFEKSDDNWKVSAEGKPALNDDDLKELADAARMEAQSIDFIYPKKAVKVGEKWKQAAKDVAKYFVEFAMDPDTVKAEGKLVKVYKKGKQQWATIEHVITF